MMRSFTAAVAAALVAGTLVSPAAPAGEARLGAVTIEAAWARATLTGVDNGAAYLRLRNDGDSPRRLVAVTTPAAGRSTIHETSMRDGTMQMKPVARVAVAPGGATVFEPGGLHVMLLDLKRPLREGDSFPLTLTFDSAGEVTVTVDVLARDAMAE